MKKPILLLLALTILFICKAQTRFIIDHTKAKLDPIPESAILQAKSNLHIAYGHTSHGSQLISGMTALIGKTSLIGYKGNIYQWSDGVSNGALDIDDYFVSGDLGANGDLTWATNTRAYLNNPINSDVNVIMWSWCGGVSTNTEGGINIYLNAMNQLEKDFPNVKFVYMTGHLNGTGESGNLHIRNEQIRAYCRNNNKILYDFADIESFNPDGNYFLNKGANDNCDYDGDGNGSRESNWATLWQNLHILNIDWYNCSPAHSQPLNGNQKAYAAWWLWAVLGGWNPQTLTISANSALNETNINGAVINLNLIGDFFTDNTLLLSNFTLAGVPAGTSIQSVEYVDNSHAKIYLLYDGTDFDNDINNFTITISGSEIIGNSNITSNFLSIDAFNESLQISTNPDLTEGNLNNKEISLSLTDESFIDNSIDIANIQLNNAPQGLFVKSAQIIDDKNANIVLSFDGTDFDINYDDFSISLSENELTGLHHLISNKLIISAFIETLSKNLTLSDVIKLYPNPGNGRFTLETGENINGDFSLDIVDCSGKMIVNGKVLDLKNCIEMDYQYLPVGLYYLVLYNSNHRFVRELIIR